MFIPGFSLDSYFDLSVPYVSYKGKKEGETKIKNGR
jgi:hypothetical protein